VLTANGISPGHSNNLPIFDKPPKCTPLDENTYMSYLRVGGKGVFKMRTQIYQLWKGGGENKTAPFVYH